MLMMNYTLSVSVSVCPSLTLPVCLSVCRLILEGNNNNNNWIPSSFPFVPFFSVLFSSFSLLSFYSIFLSYTSAN